MWQKLPLNARPCLTLSLVFILILTLILGMVLTLIANLITPLDLITECWITRSVVDVSEQLEDARQEPDPLTRANLVRNRRQEIARAAEALSSFQ